MSAKLVPTFADRRCHVVNATEPHGRILGFLDRSVLHFLNMLMTNASMGSVHSTLLPLTCNVLYTIWTSPTKRFSSELSPRVSEVSFLSQPRASRLAIFNRRAAGVWEKFEKSEEKIVEENFRSR
jgi:hypothetical protein